MFIANKISLALGLMLAAYAAILAFAVHLNLVETDAGYIFGIVGMMLCVMGPVMWLVNDDRTADYATVAIIGAVSVLLAIFMIAHPPLSTIEFQMMVWSAVLFIGMTAYTLIMPSISGNRRRIA